MGGTWQTVTADDLGTWRDYFDRLPAAGPYHSPDYLELLAGHFEFAAERAEAFVYEGDSGFVYYPYLRRPLETLPYAEETSVAVSEYSDIVASWYYGGPLLSPGADPDLASEFAAAFTEYCQAAGIVAEFIRFDPNRANHDAFEVLDPIHNRQTVPVDLTGSADDIWAGYEGRNQRAIKQARDTEIEITPTDDPADIAAFHDIYANAMEAKDADPHYRFERAFFEELLTTGSLASLLIATHGDETIGGFIAVHDERAGFHYLSASNPDYWDLRVNNLLYHEVVMYMHDTGRELFDFQGGRPGVFRFKKGFSPKRGEFYIGKRVHDERVYDRLVDDAAAAGVETDTGYFPAYRVEQSN